MKEAFEDLKGRCDPQLVLTHGRDDLHQDHGWCAGERLEHLPRPSDPRYEIPKWDGDIGRPDVYVPLTTEQVDAKLKVLGAHFDSQRGKDWYDSDTFRALMRLRGMECRSASGYAEAFFGRKLPSTPRQARPFHSAPQLLEGRRREILSAAGALLTGGGRATANRGSSCSCTWNGGPGSAGVLSDRLSAGQSSLRSCS